MPAWHPLHLDWLAELICDALYADRDATRALQRPPLRADLAAVSLACRALYEARRRVTLRHARYALFPSKARDGVDSTTQAAALLRKDSRIGRVHCSMVLVVQGGTYGPALVSLALQRAAAIVRRCPETRALSVFLGRGLEALVDDGAAEAFAASLIPATRHLRNLALVCDRCEGPGHLQVLSMLAAIAWSRPPCLTTVTLRGWVDATLTTFRGDGSYLGPWLQQTCQTLQTSVTTQLCLKDCTLSDAAPRLLVHFFGSSLEHLLISWSKDLPHTPTAVSSVQTFLALTGVRLVSLTICDHRPHSPFFTCLAPSDPGASSAGKAPPVLPFNVALEAPVYVHRTLEHLSLELSAAAFHPAFLARFACPALRSLDLVGAGAVRRTAALDLLSLLAHRSAGEFLRHLALPTFDRLEALTIARFPWATQSATMLHAACKARNVELCIRAM